MNQSLKDLLPGDVIPPISFDLPPEVVESYRLAVGDESPLYRTPGTPVLPAAVAALSLGALLSILDLPSGTLHASQELEFLAPVPPGSSLTCRCQVRSRTVRTGNAFVGLDFSIWWGEREMLKGRTTLILPDWAGAAAL